jgi:hypothetical protein
MSVRSAGELCQLIAFRRHRSHRSHVRRIESLGQHDDGFGPPSGFGGVLPRPSRCVLSDGAAGIGAFLTGLAGPGGKMDEAGATRRSGDVSNLAHVALSARLVERAGSAAELDFKAHRPPCRPISGTRTSSHTVRYTELSPTRFKSVWRV